MERPQQRGGPILSAEDSKSIFGNIPEILAVHQNIVVGRVGEGGRREGGGGRGGGGGGRGGGGGGGGWGRGRRERY